MTDPTPTERIDAIEEWFTKDDGGFVAPDYVKYLLPYAHLGAMVVEDRVVLRNAAIQIPPSRWWYKSAICKVTDEAWRIAAAAERIKADE